MKRIIERSGKGSPASVVSGSASAAASETAPRIPAQLATTRKRQFARRCRCAGRRSKVRISAVIPKPQAKRTKTTATQTSAA